MLLTAEDVVDLVHAVIRNARDLITEARLLLDHGHSARAYALAALAGEEHGKIEICLGWLSGDQPLPEDERDLRGAWRNHTEKLTNLTAYRAAFLDTLPLRSDEELRATTADLGRTKMSTIYVDVDSAGIASPADFDSGLAAELIQSVEEAIGHVAPFFAGLTRDMAPLLLSVGPIITQLMSDRFGELEPVQGLTEVRTLITNLVSLQEAEIDFDEVRMRQVVALLTGSAGQSDFATTSLDDRHG